MTSGAEKPEIERGSGVAIWRQIAEQLRAEILSGRLGANGGKLPTETDLAARFGVNRHTVRRAIASLTADGLLRADQGRGTFVADRLIDYPISPRTRFSEIIAAQSREPHGRLLSSTVEPASAYIAERLGVAEGTPLLRIETIGDADGIPLTRSSSWFDRARFPNLAADFVETGSVTIALERAGAGDYRRKETRISAEIVDPEEAKLLEIAVGQPVLVVEALNAEPDGRPSHLTQSRLVAARMQLVVEN
ncbi:phosphonate metabolism transcriptional regulator PhnF [Rhizobiales bacterium]|uniref:phosphonate metabolism transcriptional regulator PhnF n=1 Tax=Hongsoonwoonella zoysiae TaxID=2821844 RepID=UPI001560C9B7|nr:phosphonate metabolism transcriptional regulator PhnF [Hongsoonwoonella zoysiae]NRG16954.1 phosphonate metabolism transcriptional regulator PhnF [Hongsoonwoonella zoysiae]